MVAPPLTLLPIQLTSLHWHLAPMMSPTRIAALTTPPNLKTTRGMAPHLPLATTTPTMMNPTPSVLFSSIPDSVMSGEDKSLNRLERTESKVCFFFCAKLLLMFILMFLSGWMQRGPQAQIHTIMYTASNVQSNINIHPILIQRSTNWANTAPTHSN